MADFGYIKVINDEANESGWASYLSKDKAGVEFGNVLRLDNDLGSLKVGDLVRINDERIIIQAKSHHYELGELITGDWQDWGIVKQNMR